VTTPYIGEIRLGGWNFAPAGWAFCDGSQLPIAEYPALFQLLGTTYGGDGINTFALPDLRGRAPLHRAAGFTIGQRGGEEQVTVNANQLPVHTHALVASTNTGTQKVPTSNVLAALASGGGSAYSPTPPTTALAAASIGQSPGGGQPHDNMQPYLVITFIISLFGIFPSQG
jgi:microcystin-dependent protein